MNEITQPRSERRPRRITIDLPPAITEPIEATWRETSMTKAERIRTWLAKALEAERQP
jgi:hypothetical protein